jgi:hypothetical protein
MVLPELLLELLLEIFLEFVAEVVVETIFVVLLTAIAEASGPPESRSPLVAGVGYLLLGATTGGLSLIWFPFPLIHPSGFTEATSS